MQTIKTKSPVDSILENLAILVERRRLEFGVVLQVDGTLVGGTLISSQAFFELHCDNMIQMVPDIPENVEQKIRQGKDNAIKRAKQEFIGVAPSMLSLKDVTIMQGQSRFKTDAWRTRIESVSGWYFGTLPEVVGLQ